MALVHLATDNDFYKLAEIKMTTLVRGLIFCVPDFAPHICLQYNTANAVLVCYNQQFKPALSEILADVFEDFGPTHFELLEDTTLQEFIDIKLNTCICGLSTLI